MYNDFQVTIKMSNANLPDIYMLMGKRGILLNSVVTYGDDDHWPTLVVRADQDQMVKWFTESDSDLLQWQRIDDVISIDKLVDRLDDNWQDKPDEITNADIMDELESMSKWLQQLDSRLRDIDGKT